MCVPDVVGDGGVDARMDLDACTPSEEICGDGVDNDCDSEVDEGCETPDACVERTLYEDRDGDGFGDPSRPLMTCDEEVPGYVDNADDCDDDCPECFPGSEESDRPDLEFRDLDCDGIDGSFEDAVLVAPGGAEVPATASEVETSISAGIARAVAVGRSQVLVAAGVWEEAVEMASGVSVFGGYDSRRGWARSRDEVTRIVGPSPALRAVRVDAEVQLVEVASTDATAGASSIAALVHDADLTLAAVALRAGRGADGPSPALPMPRAATGASGSIGGVAGQAPLTAGACAAIARGAVGAGGSSPVACGRGGDGGQAQNALATGHGQPGGADGCVNRAPGGETVEGGSAPGMMGRTGSAGTPGTAGGTGMFAPTGYTPRRAGSGGEGGVGAGGGGGSRGPTTNCMSCLLIGAPGGGGGAGGAGGAGGLGGVGGGASIGLFAWGGRVTLVEVTVETAGGGRGGDGQLGQRGGDGGSPGPGRAGVFNSCTGRQEPMSGAGGRGGLGGDGGRGGGGAGGPSLGVVAGAGVTFDGTLADTTLGPGGQGGIGGINGAMGLVLDVFRP